MPPQSEADEAACCVLAVGFAALPNCCASSEEVLATRTQVLRRFEGFLARAEASGIDLARPENSERLHGFYVREGGRVDMQLWASTRQTRAEDAATGVVEPVDAAPLLQLAQRWQPVLAALFTAHEPTGDGGDDGFALEYIGCVVSRPGDGDQNWHLDGVHRNLSRHEPADRVNVFVPLVDIDEHTGGTEMKRGSHVRSKASSGVRASRFEAYEHLESVTHRVAAGTPVVMDYRVWHRGLANASADTARPLMYFKYALRSPPSGSKRAPAGVASDGKKRKRIAPEPV